MNPRLQGLQPYPFEKLRLLLRDVTHDGGLAPIPLSIGEPRHAAPELAGRAIGASLGLLSSYPSTRGSDELRLAIARWLEARFPPAVIDPSEQVLPVNGTREALFAFAQTVIDPQPQGALVICPNPFYQIYEGAALLAGATPRFLNCEAEQGFLPDFEAVTEDEWRRCQLLYLCSPGNPTGAVEPLERLRRLVRLSLEFDFVIAGDECYSEIYLDEGQPPPGLLQACAAEGNSDYRNCVVFHSLSKRSNLPGLRSGFVAGDAGILRAFLQYRTYHGCAMPPHHQAASVAAWSDERHVVENRRRYREKFDAVLSLLAGPLALSRPAAGFYLWPSTPASDLDFTRGLFRQQHVTVLPGRYLARQWSGTNPGENRVRMALVAEQAACVEAAERILDFLVRGEPGAC